MFEDSTFESMGRIHTRSRRWMVAAFTFNSSILLALILIPLLRPEALPLQLVPILMEAPPAPTAAEPQKPQRTQAATAPTEIRNGQIVAPRLIPTIIITPGEPDPPLQVDYAALATAPSGPNGPGQGFPGAAVRPVVRPEPRTAVRISSAVEAGLLIRKTMPIYPPIGHAMHAEGTVVLEASISKAGTIENLRVVSGPSVLRQAALDAVQTWLYRPYLLDGEPVEVETTINVIFTLSR
jgi:protein TonB